MQYTVLRYNETSNGSYTSVHGDLDFLKGYFGFKESKTIFNLLDSLNKKVIVAFGRWPKPTYKLFLGYRQDGSVISL